MKRLSPEQEALTSLMTRLYMEIREIEESCQLCVGDGDFRVRIEYFHDAVRALTQLPQNPAAGERLTVELLAYDLACLRYLHTMPLAGFKPSAQPLSPSTAVMARNGAAVRPDKPDRETKQKLGELYQHYSVLFAALFKPLADRDCQGRVEEGNQQVEDVEALIQALEKLGREGGQSALAHVHHAANHLDNEELSQTVRDLLSQNVLRDKRKLAALIQKLREHNRQADKEIAAVEEAHFKYSTAQLSAYEEGKEVVKKLMIQGLNVAGRFLESSMAAARRDAGRGR